MTKRTSKGTFAKNVSGNPGGRPKKDPVITTFKETSYKDFISNLQKYGALNRLEMAAELQRPNATMFEIMFGQIVASAAKGDKDARQLLLDRLWGKVKDQIEYTNLDEIEKEKIRSLPMKDLVTLVKNNMKEQNDQN